jgi:TPR repeat protein
LSDREVGSKGFFARPELPRVSILYGAAANQTSPDDGKLSAFLQDEIAQPGQNHIKALLNVSQSLTVARHEGKIQLKPTVTFGEFPSEFCFVSCSDGDTAKAANADNTEQVVRYRTAFDGRALLKDELSTKSIQELERAAAKGDARSLYLLAIEGWNRAPEAARENMLRSVLADNKNELSKRQVAAYGQMLLDGVGGDKSAREAQLWWKAGDRLGCPRCAYLLGDYYEDTKLYAEAFRYYEKAMNGGVLDAQAAIGDMYWWGKGVRLSQSKAVEIYKKASKSGSARGQFRLAGHHRFGTASLWDVPLDQPRARDLYVQASKLGHQQAAIEAAIMYSDGEGIPTDAAAAAALLLDPVNDNNWEAMSLLAGLLIKERIPAIKGLDPLHLAEEADKHDYPDALSSLVFSLRSDTKGRKGNLTLAAKLARGGLARAEARTTDMDAGWPLHAKNFAFAIQKALAQGLPEAGLGEGDRLKKKYGKVDGPFKQLTVPVLCGAEKVPMSVYVWDAPDEPNPPTDGQFDWAEEARACKVDVVVRKAFRDLFAIAKRENVSFTELIFYALYLAQKESSANAL